MTVRFAILSLLIALGFAFPAFAAKAAPKTSCSFADDPGLCQRKARELEEYIPKANRGDYLSQRELAFCYASGCHGALAVDLIKACAWQTVIVSTEVSDNTDAFNYRHQCELLGEDDRNTARATASSLFGKIYKKAMTKPLPYEGKVKQ